MQTKPEPEQQKQIHQGKHVATEKRDWAEMWH